MGKTVVITGSSRGIGRALAEHYEKAGWKVIATARNASIAAFANSLADTPVNLLINNAGIFEKGEHTTALVDQFVTNAVGGSTPGNPAVVANISSGMGSIGDNTSGGYYGYRASKSALNSFMKTLSLEWKPENISVLLFCPGWVQTDMGGAGAAITTTQSVTGLSGLIDKAFGDLGMTGSYLRYNGDKIEW
ncbi:NAD(P)-binding protein [Rhizoclosmatium globosum]|uniref:NAD(P)-binding protein n=1 Tax=Rhizoclosmatium globosum TaxID=329046 RepID=A0A1Y2CFZ0_9FUNG|nr:NAD(P)-binding protein [Rhizoclosmatium globosum]|eukprot:ORY45734.1 NAD(P)-binding protein [Rhizoclosmatium globosum]